MTAVPGVRPKPIACCRTGAAGSTRTRTGPVIDDSRLSTLETLLTPDSRLSTVFLFDVDNTLLDNDRVIADLRHYLNRTIGASSADQYFEIFEQLRSELGYAD